MKKVFIKSMLLSGLVFLIASCGDDEEMIIPEAGTITGGPFTFFVDGNPDFVSGVASDANAVGTNSNWIVTDDQSNILGLPPTLSDLEGVDFDGAGVGVCLIWYIRFEDGLSGLAVGESANELEGSFDLSNSITVNRNGLSAGTLSGGPFTFLVDGVTDNVSGIEVANTVDASNTGFVITDPDGKILGLPPTLVDVEGVNFDGAGAGICFIWRITYEEGITGLATDANTSGLSGIFSLSNSIQVTRNALDAGTLTGGPFTFVVDEQIDNVSDITVADNLDGTTIGYVITDADGKILGLPPTIDALEGVDFNGAGVGVCLIYRITHSDGVTGLAADMNVNDLDGSFDLSNSITVTRNPKMKTLTLDIAGLENLGDDYVYEGWVIVDGAPVSTGVFTVDDQGAWSASAFEVVETTLDAATKFVLTIEPAGETGDAAATPAAQKLLAGDFSGTSASVSTAVGPGVGDFSSAAGQFFLRTPTDEEAGTANNGNDQNGIWFGDPTTTPPGSGFTLPTLPDGWVYEGWVVTAAGPISTGTFTSFTSADSGNPFSGTANNAGPPIPGEDFFNAAPEGQTFPLDVRGTTVVISVEPSPDNSPKPFLLKPLAVEVAADAATAPTTHALVQNLGSLPTGTVTR